MSKHEVTADLFYEWYDAFRSKDFHETPQPELTESRFKGLSSPPKLFMMPDPVRGNEPPGDVPATGLTQYGAQEFCRWFSLRSGRPYRLPTEVEWEYAARAGTTTDWHFGNDKSKLGEYAWFGEKFADGSHQVGKKRPNPWGLCDMYGNASEWVLDGWSDEFGRQFKSGEADPWVRRKAGQQGGVIRGGDWTTPAAGTRSASRRRRDDTGGRSWHYGWQWYDFSEEGRRIGFRLVSPAKPESDGRESYLRSVTDEVPEKR
jgi:formylglycine-generating enzyme required for sulfatase activity